MDKELGKKVTKSPVEVVYFCHQFAINKWKMSLLFPTYRHYNGQFYRVILQNRQLRGVGKDELVCSATGETMIVYQQLYDGPKYKAGTMWVDTASRFNHADWHIAYLDGRKKEHINRRFTPIEDDDVPQHVLDKIKEIDSRWSAYE